MDEDARLCNFPQGFGRPLPFEGLLVDYVQRRSAQAVVRGLRAVSDFEFEFQLALMNRTLDDTFETIFMMPKDTYTFLSSRIVKDIARRGGDVREFVPDHVRALWWPNWRWRHVREETVPLLVDLRHLADRNVELEGELPASELDLDARDEMIRAKSRCEYAVEAQKLDQNLLLRGWLRLTLDCQCVRCLKPYPHHLALEDWTCHIPLTGEERAAVVNDCVDLTPYLREDILLAFPQHPLCNTECRGLVRAEAGSMKQSHPNPASSPAWSELDKLKL